MTGKNDEALKRAFKDAMQRMGLFTSPDKDIEILKLALIRAGLAIVPKWECKAQKNPSPGGTDTQDCDWPWCGCDPAATEVIGELPEHGLAIVPVEHPCKINIQLDAENSHKMWSELLRASQESRGYDRGVRDATEAEEAGA